MQTLVRISLSATAGLLMVVANANAHHLWIKPGNTDYRLYFGEDEMLLKEKSQGRLDSFSAPRALAVKSTSEKREIVFVTRAMAHFTIAATPAAQAVVVLDESIAVRDLTKQGVDKTSGEFDGRNYDSVRNHFTLTFIENTGTDPGPVVAPKQTME